MKASNDGSKVALRGSQGAGVPRVEAPTSLRAPERFRLIRRLGGGTSEVFAALDQTTWRVVALKLALRHGPSSHQVSREAEVLKKLSHPSIVRLEAEGIEDDLYWIATECLEGIGLDVVIRDHGPLPWPWVRTTLARLLDALEHAHAAGIAHGDVKPSNCFCCGFVDVRAPVILKLLDFGIAHDAANHAVDAGGGFTGSAAYLAPERSAGGPPTAAGDLYAVGVMAHELLLGYLPFASGGRQAVLWQQQYGYVGSLLGHPDLAATPADVLRAIDALLHKDPERRSAGARALRVVLAATTAVGSLPRHVHFWKRARDDSHEATLLRLCEHVQRIWVDDYLSETRMGFVDIRQAHRWVSAEGKNEANALLPLFERAGKHLVVLGEPGFGKTVALLKLCRALLDLRRRSQSLAAVPVVIPLSSWRGAAKDVPSWLAGELRSRYSVPRHLCRQLLGGKRLILLLDGLDEVPHGLREACVEVIDGLVRSGQFAGVVVTCRTEEYNQLVTPLVGPAHVDLARLDVSEIQRRVRSQGLSALASALETNSRLAELATVPLMLRLLQGVARDEAFPRWVERGPISAEGLLDRFLEGPLRTVGEAEGTADLLRVARLAVVEGQWVLRCEALQPRMLRARWTKVSYALLSRLVVAAIACFGPILAVGYSPFSNGGLDVSLTFALELSLKSTVLCGLLFGVATLFSSSRTASRNASRLVNALAATLAFGGAAAWVGVGRPPAAAVMALEATLLGLIAVWGARPPTSSVSDDVTLDRDLRFRLPSSRGVLFASILGALWALLALASTQTWHAAAYMGGSFAAVGLLLASMKTLRETITTVWNSAFWKALRSAYLAAALTVVVVTAGFAPAFGYRYGACVALTFGAIVFLWLGGTDGINYVLLRLHMASEGTLPFRSHQLMNRAVSARLMKRVGGGYAFVHWKLATRLLDARESSNGS